MQRKIQGAERRAYQQREQTRPDSKKTIRQSLQAWGAGKVDEARSNNRAPKKGEVSGPV